jgi:hypothetical protein
MDAGRRALEFDKLTYAPVTAAATEGRRQVDEEHTMHAATIDARTGTVTVACIAAGLALVSGESIRVAAADESCPSVGWSTACADDRGDTTAPELPRALEPPRVPAELGMEFGAPAAPDELNDDVMTCAAGRSLEWGERCGIA